MQGIKRFLNSLTTRLQITTLLMSAVGIVFSYIAYRMALQVEPALAQSMLRDLWLQIGIALLGQVVAWYMIKKLVIQPLVTLIEIMRQLEQNKYDVDVPYVTVGNQIGSFARKVKAFKDKVIYTRKLEEQQVAAEKKSREERQHLMEALSTNFDESVSRFVQHFYESTRDMQTGSESLSAVAHQNASDIQQLLTRSNTMADNITSVSAAATQLSQSIQDISRRMNSAAHETQEAVGHVKQAGDVSRHYPPKPGKSPMCWP